MLFYSFFKSVVGKEITVELKNDLCITGTLHSVDQYMNIKINNIRLSNPEKYPHMASVVNCFVRGSVVRYVVYATGPSDGETPRVDLTKLKVHALRKYTKVYEVPGIGPQSSKEDLTSAVSRHWNTMTVSEESVLQNLMRVRGRY
ncbi:hypothetical protein QBZ16_003786 [Prototheca wickerhamii]|uniref:Sm domain-containing protein n=1 Tax=Prototheca wickerhamii TaxID=3111 RepID=A0AAD9IGM7_PROWI|nr:hypothetical protein QBZ16_003786 [Prototheca wickerhamii]